MENIDPEGRYGCLVHYAFVFFFVGTALILFSFLWCKKRLDMDEEPKYQMLDDEEKGNG